MDGSNQPLENGVWSALPFSPDSMIATENTLLFGGDEALLVRAALTSNYAFEFEHIPFEPSRYGWTPRPGNELLSEDVSFGERFHIDRSTTPNQVVIHFGEYQGGAYGVSIVDINDFSTEAYISSPTGESDIAFAETTAIRGDAFISYSCFELFHFVRDGRLWTHSQIPFPSTCEASCIELTFDAKKLLVSVYDENPSELSQRTLVYERVNGRFVETRPIAAPLNEIYLHERSSLRIQDDQLWIYADPCFQGEPSHKVQFESSAHIADSTDGFTLVLSIDREDYQTVKRYARLVDNQTGSIVVNFVLPEVAEKSSIFSGVFLEGKVIIACQNQIGVFEVDEKIERSRPVDPGAPVPRKIGFDGALEIFKACSRFQNEDRAGQIITQLEQIESDSTRICEWIWRGLHEGHFAPAFALIPTLEKQKHLYSAQDVVQFLTAVDHNEPNVWAFSAQFIKSKFSRFEDVFYEFWQQTTGLMRADLGYFLAHQGIVSKTQLPPESLTRATYWLGWTSLSTHPDVTYPMGLRDAQKVWKDSEIAAGLLEYASRTSGLGNEGGQWFAFVWPFATPKQRAMLIIRNTRIRGVQFFIDFFSNRTLSPRTRQVLEDELAPLLAKEPEEPNDSFGNPTFFSYTFLTAAVVLILDAKNRNVGLSSVGGATFARAVLMGDLYRSCEITLEIKERISTFFN